MSKHAVGVFIGRFQVPTPHAGHLFVIMETAQQCDKLVILIGSANASPSITNPWDIHTRHNAMRAAIGQLQLENVVILPLNDYGYSDADWIDAVVCTVEREVGNTVTPTLFGHTKAGNNYLNWFPNWKYQEIYSNLPVNATALRTALFEAGDCVVPTNVLRDWQYFKRESEIYQATYPFPESLQFNCADAVVTCCDHVLLIRRMYSPGRDTWALPGGFKLNTETFAECAIRELIEETSIEIPREILEQNLVTTELYDSPNRSQGITRVTVACRIFVPLTILGEFPKIKARDDAAIARWVPLQEAVTTYQLFDDHLGIICDMTGTRIELYTTF